MVDLIRFETNPFDDEINISMANFHQLATDHLLRLIANNPGDVLAIIIAATQVVYNQFNIVFGSKSVEEALKKGATIGLGSSVDEILESARTLESQVKFLYKVGSQKYAAFFPLGLTELNRAGKGEWPAILARLKAATAANTVQLGGTVAADWAGYQLAYTNANAGQVDKKGTVDQLRTQLLVDRKAMARQMFINLHSVAIQFVDVPCVATYFDQSIVDRKQNANTDHKGLLRFRLTNSGGMPLINAYALIYDQQGQLIEKLTTDDNGYAKSSSLDLGFYDATFSHPTFVTQTRQYQVFDNNDPLHEVVLTAE